MVVERPLTRHSVSVPAMTPGSDHRVYVSDVAYAAYPTTDAVVGVPHVFIGGTDVTYFRGVPIVIGVDRQEGPFGDVTFSIDMPQITPQDTPGTGDLSWLVPDAPVELVMVNGATTTQLWAGFLVSDDGGNDAASSRTAWTASGTMWQASTFGHRTPTLLDPTDIGTMIPAGLNGVVAHRYPALAAVSTGINTLARGSSNDSELAHAQSLLATAWTTLTQWTVAKVAGTARTYEMRLKNRSTVHHTVTVGARGVDVNLSRDMTSTANALFGRGINTSGFAWAGWVYPGFTADTAPAYPFTDPSNVISIGTTDADTDSGTGVTDWQRRINEINLTHDVALDGVFNSSDASICGAIQADFGLSVDGVVGPQTWDASFSVGSSGGDLTASYRRPLAIASETEPHTYSAVGAITGANAGFDASVVRRERDTDYGAGVSRAQATVSALLELGRDKEPGLTGTIVLLTDPREGSRWLMTPDQNVKVLGYNGADPLLHIAAVDRDWVGRSVTLTVDEHARDAITLAAIRARDKAAMIDPARRPGRTNRRSRQSQDQLVAFDGESPGGVIPRHAVFGGLWTVLCIPLSEAGEVAKLTVTSSGPVSKFAVAFFSGPVLPSDLLDLVGDPLSGTDPFARTLSAANALDDLGLIEAFGGPGSAAGYWPSQEGTGALTGILKDTGGFSYASAEPPALWVAEWSPVSTFISGRIYPAPVQ
jgi:peptidoglycan hydrolase-like protein with peptidoglycan-binding domain